MHVDMAYVHFFIVLAVVCLRARNAHLLFGNIGNMQLPIIELIKPVDNSQRSPPIGISRSGFCFTNKPIPSGIQNKRATSDDVPSGRSLSWLKCEFHSNESFIISQVLSSDNLEIGGCDESWQPHPPKFLPRASDVHPIAKSADRTHQRKASGVTTYQVIGKRARSLANRVYHPLIVGMSREKEVVRWVDRLDFMPAGNLIRFTENIQTLGARRNVVFNVECAMMLTVEGKGLILLCL
jgi:hypothetical protein